MDAGRLKRVGGRDEEYGSPTRAVFTWIVVVVQACNCPWGIRFGESWHVHTHAGLVHSQYQGNEVLFSPLYY